MSRSYSSWILFSFADQAGCHVVEVPPDGLDKLPGVHDDPKKVPADLVFLQRTVLEQLPRRDVDELRQAKLDLPAVHIDAPHIDSPHEVHLPQQLALHVFQLER
jgi:hypothetical protein